MTPKILIVDDEANILRSFSSVLRDEGYFTATADGAEAAMESCRRTAYDVVLLDLRLPGLSGIDFLEWLRAEPYMPVVLVVSGQADIPTALQAVKLGAIDYLEKPVAAQRLISSVRSALLMSDAQRQRRLLVDEMDSRSKILGGTPAVHKLLTTIGRVAPSDAAVLITGENGTGKELVATRIFLNSNRRDRPYIKVNCPGIPPTLFESELFGHAKGAFTGAVNDYPGKFVLADGGTILLDEIGDLPRECQAKLLRTLETGEVETLGSVHRQQVDVRIICATNRNLPMLVRDGGFREDLFYRISVLVVDVPPLRDRRDDIPLLVGEFLRRFDPGQTIKLSPEALAYLTTLDYPGNVRQLKNLVERLTILFGDRTITMEDIIGQVATPPDATDHPAPVRALAAKVQQFEKHLIGQTLLSTGSNISEAARVLQVDRANLSKKIKELNLRQP